VLGRQLEPPNLQALKDEVKRRWGTLDLPTSSKMPIS